MNVFKRVDVQYINFDNCDLVSLRVKKWKKSKSKVGVRFIPVWCEIDLKGDL